MRRCIILLTVFSWVLAISAQENSPVSRVQTSILPPVAQ